MHQCTMCGVETKTIVKKAGACVSCVKRLSEFVRDGILEWTEAATQGWVLPGFDGRGERVSNKVRDDIVNSFIAKRDN